MHVTGSTAPDFVTTGVTDLRRYYKVNVNIVAISSGFEWDVVQTSPGDMSYAEIVSGLIRLKYNDDAMIAIINNYLNDMSDPQHTEEFNEMQKYRAECKETAHSAINWAIEHGLYTPNDTEINETSEEQENEEPGESDSPNTEG